MIKAETPKSGEMTSFLPPTDAAQRPSAKYPNWWTDDPRRSFAKVSTSEPKR